MRQSACENAGVAELSLSKHHGLGNDFLVLRAEELLADAPQLARRLCDRHRGVGADGLLVATPAADDTSDVTMHLFNSDGSRAEMSGNGIRCLAHALARAAGRDEVQLRIATDAGIRAVSLRVDDGSPDTCWVTVDMGAVTAGPVATASEPVPNTPARRSTTLDVGNPHLVLLVDDPSAVDLSVDGPAWERQFPHGINVHVIAPAAVADTLDLRVWERGAGLTEACGTGACAAAHAAHEWGLVGPHVDVHMPGGTVEVLLADGGATLIGPSVWIADVIVDAAEAR